MGAYPSTSSASCAALPPSPFSLAAPLDLDALPSCIVRTAFNELWLALERYQPGRTDKAAFDNGRASLQNALRMEWEDLSSKRKAAMWEEWRMLLVWAGEGRLEATGELTSLILRSCPTICKAYLRSVHTAHQLLKHIEHSEPRQARWTSETTRWLSIEWLAAEPLTKEGIVGELQRVLVEVQEGIALGVKLMLCPLYSSWPHLAQLHALHLASEGQVSPHSPASSLHHSAPVLIAPRAPKRRLSPAPSPPPSLPTSPRPSLVEAGSAPAVLEASGDRPTRVVTKRQRTLSPDRFQAAAATPPVGSPPTLHRASRSSFL